MIRQYPIIDASKFPTVYTYRAIVRSPRKVIKSKRYLVSDKPCVTNGTKNVKLSLSEIANVITAKILATIENWMKLILRRNMEL